MDLELLDSTRELLARGVSGRCFIGFDGFRDEIIRVVDRRHQDGTFEAVGEIKGLAQRIAAAAGHSTNLEMSVQEVKIGGNGPIFAAALQRAGHKTSYAGAIGEGKADPLFEEFAASCERAICVAAPGHSDALEFGDGKIILGKYEHLASVKPERLLEFLPAEGWAELIDDCDLVALMNWTMLSGMTAIWQWLLRDVLPLLSNRSRSLMLDLADPSKRSDEELAEAMNLLAAFADHFQTILGLNLAEAARLCRLYGLNEPSRRESDLERTATDLRLRLGCGQLIVHTRETAAVATAAGVWSVSGPVVEKPRLSTGAGDNFNAGYCHGLLCGATAEQALVSGRLWAAAYVSTGVSPSAV